ncbi:MAG: hypothetical protein BLM47_08455 [Candidatus Reconcilbacillus cellulovorans]|uniref:Uncharacterized protein n=1 Tax=Candidatus Reconcilbacillus cellulovorans TaxID=1906605 RepID=A0A2A6DZP3_9BACL|nr:MAG: hypothetical protein BLM47_08455 [Candidatus Reconcilbacillus cellulovorans]
MNKRMSGSDYLFSLLFVFMLVCATGAFFFGYRLGVDRTVARLAPSPAPDVAAKPAAYRQQDLVSFYHNVYEPFQTFVDRWFAFQEELEAGSFSGKSPRPGDIADAARQAYQKIETFSVSSPSPLLEQAHVAYLKSLKLFLQTAGSSAPAGSASDEFLREAKRYALEAQRLYYASILKWEETVHPVPAQELLEKTDLSFDDWAKLNLNAKNVYVAALMERNDHFLPVRPHDLTARVDELIRSDQPRKWNVSTVDRLAQLLVDTDAVRRDDFAQSKDRLYAGQLLPDLPFFRGASEMAAGRTS